MVQRLRVEAPEPIARPFGLLEAATVVEGEDGDRWENGVEWQDYACDPAVGLGIICPADGPQDPKAATDSGGVRQADPFVVYAAEQCGPVGRTYDEAKRRARAHLVGGEGYAVERAVWTGEHGNAPALADPSTEDLTPAGDPRSLVGGVSLLEEWLASNVMGLGTIHVPVQASTFLAAGEAIARQGNRWVTSAGTRVAVGAGYSVNTGPDGVEAPAGRVWLYATGQVTMRRSEVLEHPTSEGESLDHRTNSRLVLAERVYAVGWTCGAAGVQVAIGASL